MSKTSSPDLYELIQSLSKAEKRHFKVFSEKHVIGEGNKYVLLFDEIEAQNEYDEDALIKQFTHFPSLKKRLYDSIMRSLAVFYSEQSTDAWLYNNLRYIKILLDKALLGQAKKLITKTKEIAKQHENFPVLYALFMRELEIIRSESYVGVNEEQLNKVFDELYDSMEVYKNAREYHRLGMQFFIRVRKVGGARSQSDWKKYSDILKHPLLKNEKNAKSLEAKFNMHMLLCGYHFMRYDFAKANTANDRLINLIEENPHMKEERSSHYHIALQNQIICQYQMNDCEKALGTIEKYKVKILTDDLPHHKKSNAFYFSNAVELFCLNRMGKFKEAVERIPLLEAELKKYDFKPLHKEYECLYLCGISKTYFGAGNYKEANKFLNRVLNETAGDLRSDIHCFMRIIGIIMHYEMGNQDLLEYMVKWAYRYLAKRNKLYKFETIILEFIRKKIQKLNTRSETVSAFTALKKELEKLLPDPYENRPLIDFEFLEWLESKIENKPFAEIVSEKYSQR
ncbi:MAG: hypothetical protein HY063_00390 [Bacteroidetes bacterium]|nr:hypothetical protein [Bacteroidota bacterium]